MLTEAILILYNLNDFYGIPNLLATSTAAAVPSARYHPAVALDRRPTPKHLYDRARQAGDGWPGGNVRPQLAQAHRLQRRAGRSIGKLYSWGVHYIHTLTA